MDAAAQKIEEAKVGDNIKALLRAILQAVKGFTAPPGTGTGTQQPTLQQPTLQQQQQQQQQPPQQQGSTNGMGGLSTPGREAGGVLSANQLPGSPPAQQMGGKNKLKKKAKKPSSATKRK